MIVLANGKKIFPEEIEAKLNEIDEVKESFVFEKDNKIYAKIVSVSENFKSIEEKVKELNISLPQFKKINDIVITSQDLEKTTTGKIKRKLEYEKIKEEKSSDLEEESSDNTFKRIERILIEKLGNRQINKESNLILDFGADSLDMVEIFLAIEKEFNIQIEKEQRKKVTKVKDLLDIVTAKTE